MKKPKLLVFDVNETLLDLGKLKNAIEGKLNHRDAFSLWFSTLLQYSMVASITANYHTFGKIGKATLKMTGEKLGKKLSEEEINEILLLITQLPPHSDVKSSLQELKRQSYRMTALTNGSSSALKAQMDYADIGQYFEQAFSVEEVKSFKPQALTYQHVLKQMNTAAKDAIMIAAHPWDLAGAKAVGMQTAFIARPSQIYYPLMEQADYIVQDLEELIANFSINHT